MFHDQVADHLGLFPLDRTFVILLNASIVYAAALLILRLGKSRFLGKNTAFDVVLGFILGSTLSRAVNGDAPLLASIIAAALLVTIHYGIASVTYRSERLGRFIKGAPEALVLDGKIIWENMDKHKIGPRDLEESMRVRGNVIQVEHIKVAFFERDGKISIVPAWDYKRAKEDSDQGHGGRGEGADMQKAEKAAQDAKDGPPGGRERGGDRIEMAATMKAPTTLHGSLGMVAPFTVPLVRSTRDSARAKDARVSVGDRRRQAHVLEIEVEDGVQTVRVELV